MKIEPHERSNPVWVKLREHFERRLDIERKKNDSVTLDAEQTAFMRGKIAALKELLGLDREGPAVEGGSQDLP